MIRFHDLYTSYVQDVYRFAFWLCGNAAEAEDITSETFVRAFLSGGEIRVSTVKAYLFVIARNLYHQNRKRAKEHTELTEDMEDGTASPDHLAEVHSELDAVMAVLRTLPEVDRSVLIMRAQDGLSYEEIAAAHGISVTAAKVKVHRARLKLARMRSEEKNL